MTGFDPRGLLKLQLKGNPTTGDVEQVHEHRVTQPIGTVGAVAAVGDAELGRAAGSFMPAFLALAVFEVVLLPVLLVLVREMTDADCVRRGRAS